MSIVQSAAKLVFVSVFTHGHSVGEDIEVVEDLVLESLGFDIIGFDSLVYNVVSTSSCCSSALLIDTGRRSESRSTRKSAAEFINVKLYVGIDLVTTGLRTVKLVVRHETLEVLCWFDGIRGAHGRPPE